MRYFSTNRKAAHVNFRAATLNGQPADQGLYFPAEIPLLTAEFWTNFSAKPQAQIAFEVIQPFVGTEIPADELLQICAETVNFPFPLKSITGRIATLELFHGATLAFKDVGARFMSRCLRYFTRERSEKTLVIVATSGDTGGAVAHGFYETNGVEVVILYPQGKVSKVQELQLTTPSKNITALAVKGNFDDCQRLAKTALADAELKRKGFLISANSINIARWLPQQFYYFFALQQWQKFNSDAPVICVPSGNFGNLCAGMLAYISGLPCAKFIAACNANDVIPRYLQNGKLEPKPTTATLSNAMDVAQPSNFVRILELFDRDYLRLKDNLIAVSVSDAETAATLREVCTQYKYMLDPHGAVGFFALEKYLQQNPEQQGFFLETAHPVKFESVEEIVGSYGAMPLAVSELFARPEYKTFISANYEELKTILLSKI